MFNLRNYINQSVKMYLKDSVIDSIKQDIIKELNEMSEFKVSLKKYKLKTSKKMNKMNVWVAMETLDIEKLSIDTRVMYKNGVDKDNSKKFKTIGELYTYCREFKYEEFSDEEILGFTEIKLYAWYKYKSDKSDLQSEYFVNNSKDVYGPEAYVDVMKQIETFLDKRPELLV